ncbi:MAG: MFS transporter [Nocardioides sp.]|nr:MFS transporter [Nocardioidaceae bacterium]MCB8956373.1 MFS transporter [Nocardioides sp.]
MSENATPAAAADPSGQDLAGAGPSGGPSGEYTHRQVLTILSGLMLGMFLGALDQTIVSTSIRTIADDLHGLSVQAWVTTAYLITATITTPIYGKLGDLYGRKKLFMFAITVFVVGSALCSFANSMYQLAAFRAIQGIGAGGLFTLVLAIIGDIVSPRERARYSGYFMAMFGTSSVLGPLIGGFFAGQATILGIAGWRWVFLVNVPIGIAALLVVQATLHVHPVSALDRSRIRVDWWGAAALVVALVPLLTVAEQGYQWGWDSPRSVACFVVGGIGLVAFVVAEHLMGSAALIPLRIFRIRAAAVTIAASVIVGMAMFGGIMLLPLYMQIVHGASPTESGLLMLPMVVGMMTSSIGSGQIISRTGHVRMFPILGSALMVAGLALLSLCGADTALVWVSGAMFVLGIGLGNCMQPLLLIVQSAVPPTEIGVATSSATFFRQIGGTLGVAIFLSVLFSSVGGNIADAIRVDAQTEQWQQTVTDPQVLANPLDKAVITELAHPSPDGGVLAQVQDDSSIIDQMHPVLAHPFKVGFATSMDLVFLLAAAVGVLAFLILLLLPRVELRATSARVAVQQAQEPPV